MRHLFSLLISLPLFLFSQEDLPFQVLVAREAAIYGEEVKSMQFVDDVTSIDVKEGGFLSLVHKGGTTYELTEKIFTFYLKPEKQKNREVRPDLRILFNDSSRLEQNKLITVLHPSFDRSGFLVWNIDLPFEFYWHLHDKPVVVYVLTISDGDGNKIQDFRTKHPQYTLRPSTFGLEKPTFMIQLFSTFANETTSSKRYQIQLEKAPIYETKCADLVLKALDLELSPVLALEAWQQALKMPNGDFYYELFEFFLKRNRIVLTAEGEDIALLLSQNK